MKPSAFYLIFDRLCHSPYLPLLSLNWPISLRGVHFPCMENNGEGIDNQEKRAFYRDKLNVESTDFMGGGGGGANKTMRFRTLKQRAILNAIIIQSDKLKTVVGNHAHI